jgi:phospholipid/cholesterol/gamma-HCH transport system permease protein
MRLASDRFSATVDSIRGIRVIRVIRGLEEGAWMNSSSLGLLSPVALLGRSAIDTTRNLGKFALFAAKGLALAFVPPFRPRRILQQIEFIGMKSVIIVSLTGLFTGMVLGIQGYYTLVRFGSESLLGALVGLSLIKELGPVLTALMVTGRAGSSMAAELGIMRISEQIDALETMDIDPGKYLVSPRIAASLIAFPLLTAICDVVGIIGGYISGVILLGINSGTFIAQLEHFVVMKNITDGFIKSVVFSLIVSSICCYQGFTTHEKPEGFGARGVGLSTTRAVVLSSVTILLVDYILTSVLL